MIIDYWDGIRLFHNSLFEIFSEVGAHYACHMVGSHFLHVVVDHYAHEFLEACGLWIPGSTGSPAGEFLALARFLSLPKDTPEVYFDLLSFFNSSKSPFIKASFLACDQP